MRQYFSVAGFVIALSILAAPASARDLYFDIWCQDQGYDHARCEAQSPADVAAFEQYWRTVERYEEEYHWNRGEDSRFKKSLNALDQALPAGVQNY
jgi:hypothetical protein